MYFKFDYSAFVIIEVTIIGCREDGYNCWEFLGSRPFVHLESLSLGFVGPYYRYDSSFFEKTFGQFATKKVRAPPHIIRLDEVVAVSGFRVDWICPNEVTKQSSPRNLSKPIDSLDVIELPQPMATDLSSYEMPPWTHRNFLLMRQARGIWSKSSIVTS